MIQSVNSNTSLTLDKPFAETTATNSNYRILLNTAAHFPSDTAAKVERALEQLSDINEAAINNDRTVTAATKVNGKGIESTTGYINLNPPSVNSNDGGSLRFHYNQSSSATSKIYEDASGRIKIDADLNFTKHLEGPLNKRTTTVTRGANTDGTQNHYLIRNQDTANKDISVIYEEYKYNSASDYNNAVGLYVYDPTENTSVNSKARIQVGYNQDGAWTYAPTPATNDNSTKIATTAYTRAYTSATYLPLSCSSPITGTIMKDTTHTRGGTDVYSPTDTVPLVVRDANGKNWCRIIASQKYTSSSDFYSSVGFYIYHPTNASQNSNVANIAVGYDQNGPYTAAPTPATNDDSTKIATTAYVKDCVPKSVGSSTNPVYTNSNGVVTACDNTGLMNALINSLSPGTSNPNIADYIITQYASGGTSNNTYYRRPISNLWNTLKGEATTTTVEYNTGYKPYSNVASRKPTFYKWGHFVTLYGTASPDGNTASDSGILCIAPSGYRPPITAYALCQGSGKAWWLLIVDTNGNVNWQRYGNGESQSYISSGAWMPFTITYYVA